MSHMWRVSHPTQQSPCIHELPAPHSVNQWVTSHVWNVMSRTPLCTSNCHRGVLMSRGHTYDKSMSHVTRVTSLSYSRTCIIAGDAWVMSHIRRVNESCHTHVTSDVTCHTCEWGMQHIWRLMSRSCLNDQLPAPHSVYQWVMSHARRVNESCHTLD